MTKNYHALPMYAWDLNMAYNKFANFSSLFELSKYVSLLPSINLISIASSCNNGWFGNNSYGDYGNR